MSGKVAVRNIRLCEKDCLCLYVCPTGASDTENSVIDVDKCIGCGACAEACPDKAISMVPREYPPQQVKTDEVITALKKLIDSKAEQETLAVGLPGPLARAMEKSNRIMEEDFHREAGYMLPQSGNVYGMLEDMLNSYGGEPGFPAEAVKMLLESISFNEPPVRWQEDIREEKKEVWKCSICGYVHEGPLSEDFKCPICRQPADKFVRVD